MNKQLILFAFILISFFIMMACGSETDSKTIKTSISKSELINRGKYLVDVIGCADCHSPKSFGPNGPFENPELALSGHPSNLDLPKVDEKELENWVLFNHHNTAVVGPWGVSFSANLTSDESGIGNWSEEQFRKAMKEGKYKGFDGTRSLLPPMPWQNYSKLSDEDINAIYHYLKSTKPVRNVVPNPVPLNELSNYKSN
jgi:mono/diheme cytochrome c family protein